MSKRRKMLNRKRAGLIARLAPPQPASSTRTPPGVRLREARPDDIGHVRELCALAEVNLETQTAAAIKDGRAGALLRAGRDQGVEAFFGETYRTLPDLSDSALLNLFLRLTHVVVAEHREAGVVGTALVFPPAGVVINQLNVVRQMGASFESQLEIVLAGGMRVTRVKAVAVDRQHRRTGIGASLVAAGIAPFVELGYSMTYGVMSPQDGLEGFYKGQGFTVLPAGSPLSLAAVGLPAEVQADLGERFFVRYP